MTADDELLSKHSFRGSLPVFRQTHAVVRHPDGHDYLWTARNNRKGRHRLQHKRDENKQRFERRFGQRVLRCVPPLTAAAFTSSADMPHRIFTALEFWSISWWVAVICECILHTTSQRDR